MAGLGEDLRESVEKGDAEAVMKLLLSNVDVNDKNRMNGMTALHWACLRGHSQVAQLLISHGADVKMTRNDGRTPIELCSSPETLRILGMNEEEIQHHLERDQDSSSKPHLAIIPSYITYRPFPYISPPNHTDSNTSNTHNNEDVTLLNSQLPNRSTHSHRESYLILKVRLTPTPLKDQRNGEDEDFIEFEFPSNELTMTKLLQYVSRELEVPLDSIERLRKLPNVRLRNDFDVKRLQAGAELEVILK